MKQLLSRLYLLLAACVLFAGCGNNEYQLSEKDLAAFMDAPPEMKIEWEKGLKANKANDYLAASTSFRALLSQQVTPQQLVAVQTALGGLNERMNDAAAKGDTSAQKALETLKAGAPRR
ncbi:MAG: hypothetical protein V9H26_04775 [Verrucomicrobiota bacterium]|nr:hypothetical protein [Limisphaerales bacterium]